jgi:hypothetical protein
MAAIWNIYALKTGDSLFSDMTVYYTNTQISGVVKYNGGLITSPVSIIAAEKNMDIAESSVWSQNGTGNFTITVTNKLSSYKIGTGYLGWGGYVYAYPGDANVILNIVSTSVGDEKNGSPVTYSLNQNYPNPFNPVTSISFEIPQRENVNLTIYNQLGQKVSVLINEVMSPGSHSVIWNAVNMTSGVYFYELRSGNFRTVKKLVLIK